MTAQMYIIDYGSGNLRSVQKAFEHVGVTAEIGSDPGAVRGAAALVLPGVGAFGAAMAELERRELVAPIQERVKEGVPFLGVCLGLQLLFEGSQESPGVTGLGLFQGDVRRLPAGLKVPHIGWNQIEIAKHSELLEDVPNGTAFYFVHSYVVVPRRPQDVLTFTEYDVGFVSGVNERTWLRFNFTPRSRARWGYGSIATSRDEWARSRSETDMRLFPAIDIQNGQCVRLRRGDFADSTVFGTDPVEVARNWEQQGARYLHVVDLDGARLGSPQNFGVVAAIAEALSIPVQLGGGIRTLEALDLIAQTRVARVIVGTAAIGDDAFLREALRRWGEGLVVAVDAQDGFIATHGWQKRTLVPVAELAEQLVTLGVNEVLYTDVSRDGMMRGMNIKAYEELAQQTTLEIIASGGVTTLEDLVAVKALEPMGVTGVIAGRALYEGSFTLAEALAVLGVD